MKKLIKPVLIMFTIAVAGCGSQQMVTSTNTTPGTINTSSYSTGGNNTNASTAVQSIQGTATEAEAGEAKP